MKAIVVNSSWFVRSRDWLMPWSGTGSWVTGNADHRSADWWVTKCDPLSALVCVSVSAGNFVRDNSGVDWRRAMKFGTTIDVGGYQVIPLCWTLAQKLARPRSKGQLQNFDSIYLKNGDRYKVGPPGAQEHLYAGPTGFRLASVDLTLDDLEAKKWKTLVMHIS